MITTCRLCACDFQDSKTVSIFSFNQNRLILDLISIFCPIRIERADNLPQKICNSCLKLILDANELREKSVRSDYKLRQASLSENVSYDSPTADFEQEIGSEQTLSADMVAIKEEKVFEIIQVTENAAFEEDSSLNLLEQVEIDNPSKSFVCSECGVKFKLKITLNKHIKLKHPVKKREYLQYSQENLKLAIAKVKAGKLSPYRAAKTFNIPPSTLKRKAMSDKQELKRGAAKILSESQELELVSYIQRSADDGQILTTKQILKEALLISKINKNPKRSFGRNGPSKVWYKQFLKRHPSVDYRKYRKVSNYDDSESSEEENNENT